VHSAVSDPVPDMSSWPSRPQLAARLGISKNTVARLAAAGDLVEVRISPQVILIDPESVQRHLARNTGPREAVSAA